MTLIRQLTENKKNLHSIPNEGFLIIVFAKAISCSPSSDGLGVSLSYNLSP